VTLCPIKLTGARFDLAVGLPIIKVSPFVPLTYSKSTYQTVSLKDNVSPKNLLSALNKDDISAIRVPKKTAHPFTEIC
jgi:hypothetical protein